MQINKTVEVQNSGEKKKKKERERRKTNHEPFVLSAFAVAFLNSLLGLWRDCDWHGGGRESDGATLQDLRKSRIISGLSA